jgi:Leucine-rich repeat (LRR) protein
MKHELIEQYKAVKYSKPTRLIPIHRLVNSEGAPIETEQKTAEHLIQKDLSECEERADYTVQRVRQCFDAQLPTLELRNLSLPSLPSCLQKLTSLIKIDLTDNRLDTLTEELFTLPNLKELIVKNNKLITIPFAIEQCINLEVLDCSFNRLNRCPRSIRSLQRLRSLDLTANKLSTLPDAFDGLTHLTHLNIGFNQIDQLPPSLKECLLLERLDTSINKLQNCPEWIDSFKNLKELYFAINSLRTVPPSLFNLHHLEVLDLSQNHHLLLPSSPLPIFPNLQECYLEQITWESNWPAQLPDDCLVIT